MRVLSPIEAVVCDELQVLALNKLNLVSDVLAEKACPDLGSLGVQQNGHGVGFNFGFLPCALRWIFML